MAKLFNPAASASTKLNISLAVSPKATANNSFLVRRVVRGQRRARRAL